jgi:hypothetical protein
MTSGMVAASPGEVRFGGGLIDGRRPWVERDAEYGLALPGEVLVLEQGVVTPEGSPAASGDDPCLRARSAGEAKGDR